MTADRTELLDVQPLAGEDRVEASLRPRRLNEFIGQERVKRQLDLVLQGALGRGQSADHVLLSGPPGLGKPVADDTPVLMADGARKPIRDIAVGEQVITSHGRSRPVTGTYEQGELRCLRITTQGGRSVTAAPDHPFLTTNGWTKAGDLRVGDVLTLVSQPRTRPTEPQRRDQDFRLAGTAAHRGHVPEFVLRGSPSQVSQFLGAYLPRAGSWSRPDRDGSDLAIEFADACRPLLEDVQHLLLRIGVDSRLVDAGDDWRLQVTTPQDVARLATTMPVLDRSARNLAGWARARPRVHQPLRPDRIARIADAGFVACRCIEVADDHTYTVSDLVCHNTSLAHIIATELHAQLRATSGPALERAGDLAAILTNLEAGDVLFVDEVHRLPRPVEEVLYPALEDFQIDIVVGKGPGARSIRLDLPHFTLVGATTRTGLMTSPLRDRFGFAAHLEFYDVGDLERIVRRSAGLLNISIDPSGAREIAARSRGTPRIANRLLRRVRDYAQVEADGRIDTGTARAALQVFEVDELGLDRLDRRVLETVAARFGGGPVGLSTLATAVGEEPDTIQDVVEPFLIQQGLIQRTPRGRVATGAAYAHLRLDAPEPPVDGPTLFKA